MRNQILILFLILTLNNWAQSYKVTYKIEPINLIENNEIYKNNKSERVKNILENTIEYVKKEKYILLVNKSNSYFTKKTDMNIDFDGKSSMMYSKLASLIASFNKILFVDFDNNYLTFKRNLGGKYFIVKKDEFFEFNWELKEESKTILGYQAKKAIGTYYDIIRNKEFEIVAWYIPTFPISAGPDIYFGLPGLVGEVHLRKAIVKINLIEKFEKNIEKPNFENVVTYEEYKNLVAKGNKIIKREYN